MLFLKPKYETSESKVYKRLKKAGKYGVYNYELNKICMRFGAVLFDMRRDGHHIQTVYIKRGVYKYYLVEDN